MFRHARASLIGMGRLIGRNQPSFVNSAINPAGVNTPPRTVVERGTTRTVKPVIAATHHQRLTFLGENPVTVSEMYSTSPTATLPWAGLVLHMRPFTVAARAVAAESI